MSKKERILIFLPGNPSIPNIYADFLSDLKNQLSCEHVFDLIHLGQDPTVNMHFSSITLKNVIDSHRKMVKEILSTFSDPEIILVGHSLGCTVICDFYEEFNHLISEVYLLMPFIKPLSSNKIFVKLLGKKIFNKSLYKMGIFLSKSKMLMRIICKKYGKEKANLLEVHLQDKLYLKNLALLLLSYDKTFQENDFISKLSREDLSKIKILFAQNDFWSPIELMKLLPPNVEYKIDETLSHDFCLTQSECYQVSSHIKEFRLK